MTGQESYLKRHLMELVESASHHCGDRSWKNAWRILLRASRVALDMAQRADGSEKERYLAYSDELRGQASSIRKEKLRDPGNGVRPGKLKGRQDDKTNGGKDEKTNRRKEEKTKGRRVSTRKTVRKQLNDLEKAGSKSKNMSRNHDAKAIGSDWLVKPEEIEAVSFDDVAGLTEVKKEILSQVILPFCDPEQAAQYNISTGGGMLLYGPPGTGKTMIAKAVANEVDAPFFSITPAHIIDKHVGEAEKRIADLFRQLRSLDRAILFIDEAEGLLTARTTHSTVMKRVVPQFLMELDGLSGGNDGLMVIAATNVPWDLDEAAYRRLPTMIYVPLPDESARKQLLTLLLARIERLGDVDIELLADRTCGFSGSDLKRFVQKTCRTCLREAVGNDSVKLVGTADFMEHLGSFSRTVSRKNMQRFDRFQAEFRG